jgi:hypothetical protein
MRRFLSSWNPTVGHHFRLILKCPYKLSNESFRIRLGLFPTNSNSKPKWSGYFSPTDLDRGPGCRPFNCRYKNKQGLCVHEGCIPQTNSSFRASNARYSEDTFGDLMLIIKRGIGCLRKCKDTIAIAIAIVLVYSWLCKWHIPVFSGTKIHHLSHSVWLSILQFLLWPLFEFADRQEEEEFEVKSGNWFTGFIAPPLIAFTSHLRVI